MVDVSKTRGCGMQQSGTPAPVVHHSILGKLFHWGFVAIFAYGIYKQVDNISQLADGTLLRFEVFFAALFLILLWARFFYMSRMQSSALPENTHAVQKLGAKVVHFGMYVAMGLIAASGLIIGVLYTLFRPEGLLISVALFIHEASVTASYWLIGLHIAAALYHRFLCDGVWSAMVPIWRE
jgi:cytochrome b561